MPRTLLVTWTPPGDRNVGEIILRDLCSLFPPDSLRVCEVSRFTPGSVRFEGIRLTAPDENAWRPMAGRLGGLLNHARIRTTLARQADAIAGRIARYAKQEGIERIWITLNSQTLTRLAHRLAKLTGLPLLSLVWDPAEFLARYQGWDGASVKWARRNFDRAMSVTSSAMVVSDTMVEEYGDRFGVRCTVVRHAFDLSTSPAPVVDPDPDFKIGFAGTLYDPEQLDRLVQALSTMRWSLGGRRVRLRIVGNYFRFSHLTGPAHVELMGWRSTDDTRALLAQCDAVYLPIPFGAKYAEFARLAFPTKLSTYLAAGRPVLVHAPHCADVARFCAAQDIGAVCHSMDAQVLAGDLQALQARVSDPALVDAVRDTCVRHFSRDVMRRQFATFLGVDEGALLA